MCRKKLSSYENSFDVSVEPGREGLPEVRGGHRPAGPGLSFATPQVHHFVPVDQTLPAAPAAKRDQQPPRSARPFAFGGTPKRSTIPPNINWT